MAYSLLLDYLPTYMSPDYLFDTYQYKIDMGKYFDSIGLF